MKELTLHPNVDRVLQSLAVNYPAQAEAATTSLHIMAGALLRSTTPPERLWSSSALGRTGFPIEFAFVSNDSSLRITTEVTGPEIPPAERLTQAETLFAQLHGNPLPVELSQFFHDLQRDSHLKYGAWLASRHKTSGTSYKIYVEIPSYPDNSPMVTAWEQELIPRTATRPARLRMVGFAGDSHTIELYYDTTYLWPRDLPALMAPMNLEEQAHNLLDTLFQAYRRPVQWELPGSDYGFSYAVPYPGSNWNNKLNDYEDNTRDYKINKGIFSLYTFANALFGGDHSIRAAILDLARRQGWENPLYEELSRPIQHKRGFITHHGVFGIVISPTGPAAIAFGLTPPATLEREQ